MPIYQINITEMEEKVLEAALGGKDEITAWIQHSIKNKARKRTNVILKEKTNYHTKIHLSV